jgi:pyrophosphatase PpaX
LLLGIKLIIYDLDGVLIESKPAIRKSVEYTLKDLDLKYDIEKIMELMGTPIHKIFEQVFREDDQNTIEEAVKRYRENYLEKGKEEVLIQDKVFETLEYFRENGLKQSIASNSSRVLMQPILSEIGLMEYIDLFIGVEDVEKPKPHPNILELTMQKLGVAQDETVFVDDSSTGLSSGKTANVHTIGITTGVHTTNQIKAVDPDFIITNLDDLKEIIKIDEPVKVYKKSKFITNRDI